MIKPVINWHEQSQGVDLYWDSTDDSPRYYAPRLHWQPLQINPLGGQLTLIAGEITLDISAAERAGLQNGNPSLRFIPLSPTTAQTVVGLSVPVAAPHTAELRVMQTLPFPKVVLSATIKHSDPNYQNVIDAIQQAWNTETLLTGKMTFDFDMSLIEGGYQVKLSRGEVYNALVNALGNESITTAKAIATSKAVIVHAFGNWWKPINHMAGISLRTESEDYLAELVFQTWFRETIPTIVFDGNRQVRTWALRDKLEMEAEQTFVLRQLSPKTLRLALLS